MDAKHPHPAMPYGVGIQQAIASGNLAQMKAMAAQAEEHLKSYGDISAALESLKLEIAKHEAKH